jgi:nicotinamide-nucleotide amidase
MRAHIIAVGNELLEGKTLDTNSHFLTGRLTDAGFRVVGVSVVGDHREAILEALRFAGQRAEYVFITGGLGPTSDDRTKEVLAEHVDRALVLDESVLDDIRALLARRGIRTIGEGNRSQALVLEGCRVIRNGIGTAPGLWIGHQGAVFVAMPGVPFEMQEMMDRQVIPAVQAEAALVPVVQRAVLTTGVPESSLAAMLRDWEAGLGKEGLRLAYLPTPGMVKLRISADGPDRQHDEKRIARQIAALQAIIPDNIFGYDDDTAGAVVGRALRGAGATLATAESCTGGNIARLITAEPGASDYYLGSIIAYANRVKTEALGVDAGLIETHGAVSEQVVVKMAEGVMAKLGADFAVATSGIAGPGGGTQEKPVGTTWIAAASKSRTVSKKFTFGERRHVNIQKSAVAALDMVRRLISEDGRASTPDRGGPR